MTPQLKFLAQVSIDLIQDAYDQYDVDGWVFQRDFELVAELRAKGSSSWFSDEEVWGIIVKDATHIYIVFRGTRSMEDWTVNLQTDQCNHAYGKIHEGFYNLSKQMWRTIATALQANRDKRVVFCGHSLGAAVSTLCAFQFSAMVPTNVTFASPRVGDLDFNKYFNLDVPNSYNILNTEDIVPALPLPCIKDRAYSHVGEPICFTRHLGSIVRNHSTQAYKDFVNEPL